LLVGEHAPDGVVYRDLSTGTVVRTPAAPQIRDLDSLPWPDRGRIDIHRYLAAWRERHGVGSVSLITARGCPYSCRWCSHSTYGKTHRRRSPASVADEAEWILNQYGPEMLWYADDVFTIHHGWTLKYAAELKRRGIRIPFECITRADRLNPQIADTLAEMGCFRVWIGSESGSQRVLDAMERGVRVEQVQEAVALVRKRSIQAGMFLMWGYEGEQIEDIEATVDHVKQCRPDVFLTTVSYPIKGTGYYDDVRDKLVRIGEWSESTDRDWHIRGRHSRRYFQFADELLRNSMEEAPDSARIAAARDGLRATSAEVEA
jgi:anaerobic magnesium-protoporphyrin IX monomethyl ester cyclase